MQQFTYQEPLSNTHSNLSQYHSLEGADESTLHILNELGGQQKALFSTSEQWPDLQRNVIFLDGIQNPADVIKPDVQKATLTITRPPHSSYTRQLVEDLFKQAQVISIRGRQHCSYNFGDHGSATSGLILGSGACPSKPSNAEDGAPSLLRQLSPAKPSRIAIFYFLLPEALGSMTSDSGRQLGELLSGLLRPDSGHETTIVLMPPSKKTKRSSFSPYGNYAMPEPKNLRGREAQSEALLTAPSAPQTSPPSHRQSTPHILQNSSTHRVGILPVCQTSLEKLVDATNNCSGHGLPYLKYNGTSDKNPSCYTCKCRKTVLDRGDGKGVKTVEWAGPACSKKDVSMPFWLLAGISIGLVATVTWGVGLIFSIGQEELPSVIGAGVAGPRAQK
ncbi:MAG: hypothetical protein Q9219_003660 [cf. Caloplaca sp. 3 TL-2023]